jgi:hypothetical protein
MILTGKVIEVKRDEFSSEYELVTFSLSPGPGRSSIIVTIPNDEGWQVNDPVEVSISMGAAKEFVVTQKGKKRKAS